MGRLSTLLGRLEQAGKLAEDTLLVLILSTMVLLAAGQIILRNFFDVGFIWGDELLRMLVLWLAVAGALAASRSDKHISIDVLNRFLPDRVSLAAKIVVHLFTAVICAYVAWHSLAFVQTSKEFEDVLVGDTPAWRLQSILPLGFGLMAWRYALFTLKEAVSLFTGKDKT